jgi:hypothetical protein
MILRPLACLAAFLTTALAQTEEPAKKDNKGSRGIQVRMLAEHAPQDLGKVLMQFPGDVQSESVDLPTNQLSTPISCPGRQMALRTEKGGVTLCSFTLPEVGNSFAIVLVTAKPSGYSPIIVRTDDPTFKAGDVFFINRSEKTVLGKLGGTALILKPGASTKNRPSQPIDNTYYDIAFAIRDETGDRLISSTRWPIDKHIRSYLFFFDDSRGKTTFRAVDEFMTPP